MQLDLGSLFAGPLDLLLYLVRRSEVDVTDLPIARITRQFSEMLEVLEFLDLDFVGEFLVMAATLTEIKSRLVLPQPEAEPEEEEGVPDESHDRLVERLLAFKRYRDAAAELDERASEWRDRYPRLQDDRPAADRDHAADRIRDVELWDLVSALGRILRTRDVPAEGRVQYDETPIHVYVERIGNAVRAAGRCAFSTFFAGTTDRHKIVAIFLAILELVRHHGFLAEQHEGDPEIWVMPPDREPTPDAEGDE
jgi:segregation and condensation protein A